jgi:hypothetical protein
VSSHEEGLSAHDPFIDTCLISLSNYTIEITSSMRMRPVHAEWLWYEGFLLDGKLLCSSTCHACLWTAASGVKQRSLHPAVRWRCLGRVLIIERVQGKHIRSIVSYKSCNGNEMALMQGLRTWVYRLAVRIYGHAHVSLAYMQTRERQGNIRLHS